jgi:hypothetical protein
LSGEHVRLGTISKDGRALLRRTVADAAFSSYPHRPAASSTLAMRQEDAPATVKALVCTARHRLHTRYVRKMGRGNCKQQIATAVDRELLGIIWAIRVAVGQYASLPVRHTA